MGNVNLTVLGKFYGRPVAREQIPATVVQRGTRWPLETDPWWMTPQRQDYPYQEWRLPPRRGNFRVSGVLYRDGVPFAGTVLLLERRSLRIVAETVSGADGAYSFESVVGAPVYMVLAFDGPRHLRPELNATVVDWAVPEPMP